MSENSEETAASHAITDDTQSTVADLRRLVGTFVAARDWEQFHSPKNLAMALSIESAELMEHFQWCTIEESRAIRDDENALAEVGEELADVLSYTLALANALGIDLSQTLKDKMAKNRGKYPVAAYQGRYRADPA